MTEPVASVHGPNCVPLPIHCFSMKSGPLSSFSTPGTLYPVDSVHDFDHNLHLPPQRLESISELSHIFQIWELKKMLAPLLHVASETFGGPAVWNSSKTEAKLCNRRHKQLETEGQPSVDKSRPLKRSSAKSSRKSRPLPTGQSSSLGRTGEKTKEGILPCGPCTVWRSGRSHSLAGVRMPRASLDTMWQAYDRTSKSRWTLLWEGDESEPVWFPWWNSTVYLPKGNPVLWAEFSWRQNFSRSGKTPRHLLSLIHDPKEMKRETGVGSAREGFPEWVPLGESGESIFK